jgi:hypothetical protein
LRKCRECLGKNHDRGADVSVHQFAPIAMFFGGPLSSRGGRRYALLARRRMPALHVCVMRRAREKQAFRKACPA